MAADGRRSNIPCFGVGLMQRRFASSCEMHHSSSSWNVPLGALDMGRGKAQCLKKAQISHL